MRILTNWAGVVSTSQPKSRSPGLLSLGKNWFTVDIVLRTVEVKSIHISDTVQEEIILISKKVIWSMIIHFHVYLQVPWSSLHLRCMYLNWVVPVFMPVVILAQVSKGIRIVKEFIQHLVWRYCPCVILVGITEETYQNGRALESNTVPSNMKPTGFYSPIHLSIFF